MKIEGSYTFNAPRERVWQVLQDPKIMAQCMPGCESMNQIGPDQYEAVMKVGVASVKGTYKGSSEHTLEVSVSIENGELKKEAEERKMTPVFSYKTKNPAPQTNSYRRYLEMQQQQQQQ